MTDLGKILLTPKGAYDSATNYEVLDVVTYERSSYVLKVSKSKGVAPTDTTKWQLLSEHGTDAFGYGYIRYSKNADGTDFVVNPTSETIYIGFYMGNSVTAPTDKTDYTWSKFIGADGTDGTDGFSPTATVTKTGKVATISITDKDGTTTETISDGENGNSLTATHEKVGKVTTVTIKDSESGTVIDTFQIEDGESGSGSGDMLKSVYDTDNNGTVDNAEAITDGTNRMTYSGLTTALGGKANATHTHVVSDITDFPSIPSKTSDLTNDSGFITASEVPSAEVDGVTITRNSSDQLTLTQSINQKISKLDSDGKIAYSDVKDTPTIPTVPTNVSAFTNDSGYLVASDISGKADKSDLDSWSSTETSTDGSTVSFTIEDATLAYDLYCENKIVFVTELTINGNTYTYTLSGASAGDVFKLRILR